ncbi:FecR family protein [Sediminibacterium ginsengisoli]|uniref:FecR protein n=1 Tax=Sediminibacterium ginsengisoli TaxID=413434 RepID=A0A1T4NXH0_9BACT|nr:FecR family protein [Sediminibacterium ginsengisoli]SJZ84070.1 FecR protein [Sediminibacterium ginsengisoli]
MQNKQTREGFRVAELIGKYLKGTISPEEMAELEVWVNETEGSVEFMREVTNAEKLQQEIDSYDQINLDEKWERLVEKALVRERANKKRIAGFTWLNVAAVVIVLLVGGFLLYQPKETGLVNVKNGQAMIDNDVAPGTRKAELILSDGSVVELNGKVKSNLSDDGTSIQNGVSGLKYEASEGNAQVLNTLKIPRGGEFQVTLPDDTKVWLNSGSTLTYPIRFPGKERRVQLSGEAYFEVKALHAGSNKSRVPFVVEVDGAEVQVLGTHFNVQAYPSEKMIKTTLLEGSVKVRNEIADLLIKPGERALLPVAGGRGTIEHADSEAAVAWKNGLFLFSNTSLKEVMEQISRWYDIDVNYNSDFQFPKYFTGEIRRDTPMSKLLEMIEMTGIAKFKLDQRTVTVLPNRK